MTDAERLAWEGREMVRMLRQAVLDFRRQEFSEITSPARINAAAGLSEVLDMAGNFLRNTHPEAPR